MDDTPFVASLTVVLLLMLIAAGYPLVKYLRQPWVHLPAVVEAVTDTGELRESIVVLKMVATVYPQDRPPFRVTVTQEVTPMELVHVFVPGAHVVAKFKEKYPSRVRLTHAGKGRYATAVRSPQNHPPPEPPLPPAPPPPGTR